MKINVFKKTLNKMSTDTYLKLTNASAVWFVLGSIPREIVGPELGIPIDIALKLIWALLFLGPGKEHTKDVVEIKEKYQEFIKNYNKLNKIFELNNPIEMHVLFTYLLKNGYLSKNRNFNSDIKEKRVINGLLGPKIISGKGVCRHSSSMFSDILNDYGIETAKLIVTHPDLKAHIKDLDEAEIKDLNEATIKKDGITIKISADSIDLVKKIVNDNKDSAFYEALYNFIKTIQENYNENQGCEISLEPIKNRKNAGNHLIIYAYKDGKSYFLDPHISSIYRIKKDNPKVLEYGNTLEIPIKIRQSRIWNSSTDYKKLRQRLNSPCISIDEEQEIKMTENVRKICTNNTDIFEQFYNENKYLYEDITDKLEKIKRI